MAPARQSDATGGSPAETPSAQGRENASTPVAAALRTNTRYVEEVVIGWNLCPWAARAWRSGEVERRVFAQDQPEVESVLTFIDQISAMPAVAVGLAIFPGASLADAAFGTFAERVRRADRARRPIGATTPFLMAAFHPDAGQDADLGNAARLVSFIRRTPDPTLQLVRASLVEALSRDGRDVSADIARENLATVGARDPRALGALLDDIRRDRGRP